MHISNNLLSDHEFLQDIFQNSRITIVTDDIVAELYLHKILVSLAVPANTVILPVGELSKTWIAVETIINNLIEHQHDRSSTLVSLGGGVIGDLTGFAASIYMRGMNLIHIPTTLLAQVDACIGGKTACNYAGVKNLLGTFYQAQTVIIDCDVLSTLPDREYTSGLAEVVKYGMSCDAELFEWLEQHAEELKNKRSPLLANMVRRCWELKSAIVDQDFRDYGQRKILNFGHTFAHAIEAATGFETYLHGEAVALGMMLATWLSVKVGMAEQQLFERLGKLLANFELPTKLDAKKIDTNELFRYMTMDKKKHREQFPLILVNNLGKVKVIEGFGLKNLQCLMEEYASIN